MHSLSFPSFTLLSDGSMGRMRLAAPNGDEIAVTDLVLEEALDQDGDVIVLEGRDRAHHGRFAVARDGNRRVFRPRAWRTVRVEVARADIEGALAARQTQRILLLVEQVNAGITPRSSLVADPEVFERWFNSSLGRR